MISISLDYALGQIINCIFNVLTGGKFFPGALLLVAAVKENCVLLPR